jgi:ABC-type multidrug transport system fused ATPase/permease subunit
MGLQEIGPGEDGAGTKVAIEADPSSDHERTERAAGGWLGRLDLELAVRAGRTVLARKRQVGPLTVQRLFYPEASNCHLYLLHPHGGVVGGDRLEIELDVGAGASVLLTTPGAAKLYRSTGALACVQQRLKIAGLNQYYGESHTLWDLDIEIPQGQCTFVMGRNGVGKTTLMDRIMGLLPLRSGSMEYQGTDLAKLAAERRAGLGIGYVPQGRQIFPLLTVEENLQIGLSDDLVKEYLRRCIRTNLLIIIYLFSEIVSCYPRPASHYT